VDNEEYDDEYYFGEDDAEDYEEYEDYDGVPNPNIEKQFPVGDFEVGDIDMPEELILNINIYLDQTWKELHKENRYAKAKQIIKQASAFFKHPSLKTKFELHHNDRIFDVERSFRANELFHTDKKRDKISNHLRYPWQVAGSLDPKKSFKVAHVYFTNKGKYVNGRARLESICDKSITPVAAIRWQRSTLRTARTTAHEIGHLLGMFHDFKPSKNNARGCSVERKSPNFMNYGKNRTEWSECSNVDFRVYYGRVVVNSNGQFCLEENKVTRTPVSPSLLYLGSKTLQLPSFSPLPGCTAPPHPDANCNVEYAVTGLVGGKVLACGGDSLDPWTCHSGFNSAVDKHVSLSSCHSLHEGVWSPEPDMREKRGWAAASTTPSGMLVTGGWDGFGYLSSTELYNGEWLAGPDLPRPLNGHCQVTVGTAVVVTGGYNDGEGWLSSAFLLDIEVGVWVRLPGMEEKREAHACAELNGEILVMGGYNGGGGGYNGSGGGMSSMEIFNLSTREWRRGPSLPSGVKYGLATIHNNTIYLVETVSESSLVFSLSGLDAEWRVEADIGEVGIRTVYPPPIVSKDILGC